VSTIADEATATLREAERLVARLPAGSKDCEAAEDIVAELLEILAQLYDAEGPGDGRGVREAVYGARALLRVISARHIPV
jgi:hypothetical protein